MVEETIRTIKETENEAEEIIKKEAGAKAEAAADLEKAKEAGRKSEQEAMDGVEKEIAALKQGALAKESEVVAAVIAELV